MIKAVIFDIDNTIYDYDRAHLTGMRALLDYSTSALAVSEKEFLQTFDRAQQVVKMRTGSDCAANHNRLLRFQCILELLGIQTPSHAMRMYHAYWDNLIAVMEPEPGLKALIAALRKKRVPIGIGSDMTAYVQYRKLERLGILDQISQITVSEETGAEKPDPRFFAACVEKMGCAAAECVFIGDSLKKDVIGAAACGLHGVWYTPPHRACGGDTDVPCIRSFEDCLHDDRIVFAQGLEIV
ncbi:MAG: HAD family hydrolase [Lachnospiraceae bacterium]|uniref:HAD family hydrolase n=1 Tax=Parablautia sp. Marseille-Q6255 TaxID=3039593 RepID=UPI0024BC0024|nr:HAD family hydrolase [Parablautia sp. Marseille-Q6255]